MTCDKFTLWFVWALLQPVKNNNLFNQMMAKRRYYLANEAACKRRASAHNRTPAGRERLRAWMRERVKDTRHRLEKNLRTRLYFALKAKRSCSARLEEKLGCTVPQFKAHIEQQFQPGWTWENWGKVWEIDHRRPCASFDLTDAEQVKRCFHFTNQRPLGIFENRSKGAKLV